MRQEFIETATGTFFLPADQAGVAFSLSPKGLKPFFVTILDQVERQSVPLADITLSSLNTTVPTVGGGTNKLKKVVVQGGMATNFKLELVSVLQDADVRNRVHVSATAQFGAKYERWLESGTNFSPATPNSPPIPTPFNNQDAGEFTFTVSSLKMNFDIDIDVETNGDPFDLSQKWSVSLQDVVQTELRITDVKVPRHSVLNASFAKCIGEQANRQAKKALDGKNLAKAFADAANARLASFPDSGELAKNITFCFPPQKVNYPEGGGMQASVSGLILYKSTKYTELAPQDLALLPVPSDADINFILTPYEIDALLWALNQDGAFSANLNAQNSDDPALFNTATYQTSLPKLFRFAPNEFFSVVAKEAAYSAGHAPSGPRTKIESRWVLSEAILTELQVPPAIAKKLDRILGIIFQSANALTDVLREQLLTPAEYSAWGAKLVAASETQSMIFRTGLGVAIKLLRQGSEITLVSSHIQLQFIGSRFEVGLKDSIQTLSFDFEVAFHHVDEFTTVKGLEVTQSEVPMWYRELLSIPINTFVEYLRPPGHTRSAVPIPHINGFDFGKLDVEVTADGMMFEGNFSN